EAGDVEKDGAEQQQPCALGAHASRAGAAGNGAVGARHRPRSIAAPHPWCGTLRGGTCPPMGTGRVDRGRATAPQPFPPAAARRGRVHRGPGVLAAKVEARNPGGSVKDRIAVGMIEAGEREGKLQPGGTVVEPTSGNTGVGLALVCILRGYKLVCTAPDKIPA